MLTPQFASKLNEISGRLGINPRDLLLIMFVESGIKPGITSNRSSAVGLIQFMPDTLKQMGLNPSEVKDFKNKSAMEQLDFVEKFVRGTMGNIGGKSFSSATQLYNAIFYPARLTRWVGTDPAANSNVVIVDGGARSAKERTDYNANKILDQNKDGKISVGDLTTFLTNQANSSQFQQVLNQFNSVAGQGNITEHSEAPNKTPEQSAPKPKENSGFFATLEKWIEDFMDKTMAFASKNNNALIIVNSSADYSTSLEYARILSSALNEELNIKSYICSDGNDVEIDCHFFGDKLKTINATKELCFAVSGAFKDATKKIGSIDTFTLVLADNKSNHQNINIKTAEINYRKFHYKFFKKD